MQSTLCFIDDHFVAATHQNGECLAVGALFKHNHALLGGAERDFANNASLAKLVLLKSNAQNTPDY